MDSGVPVLTPDPSSALTDLPSLHFIICRVLAAFHHGHQVGARVTSHGLDELNHRNRPLSVPEAGSPRRDEGAGRAGVLSCLSAPRHLTQPFLHT